MTPPCLPQQPYVVPRLDPLLKLILHPYHGALGATIVGFLTWADERGITLPYRLCLDDIASNCLPLSKVLNQLKVVVFALYSALLHIPTLKSKANN